MCMSEFVSMRDDPKLIPTLTKQITVAGVPFKRSFLFSLELENLKAAMLSRMAPSASSIFMAHISGVISYLTYDKLC